MTKIEWLELAKEHINKEQRGDKAIKCINEVIELIKNEGDKL